MNNDNTFVGFPPLELSSMQLFRLSTWSTNDENWSERYDRGYSYHDGIAPVMLIDCELLLSDIHKYNRPQKGGSGGPIDERAIACDYFDRYGVDDLPDWVF